MHMQSKYRQDKKIDDVLNPNDSVWNDSAAESITLMPTPAMMQPTEYIRNKWEKESFGKVDKVVAKAIHNESYLAFKLQWEDANKDDLIDDTDKFVDACAIMISRDINTPMITMGSESQPVDIWKWKADAKLEQQGQISSTGIGRTRAVSAGLVRSKGVWENGVWSVVLARPLALITNEPLTDISINEDLYFGLAVWEGSNKERGGIKSVTYSWTTLKLNK